MILKKITRKLAGLLLLGGITMLTGMSIASADAIADGKKVPFDRKKGNFPFLAMSAAIDRQAQRKAIGTVRRG